MVVPFGYRVGWIEPEPPEFRPAPDGDPSMRCVGADEARLAGRRDRPDIAADVQRRQAEPTQAGNHHMREILADAALALERLHRLSPDVGRFRVIGEIALDALVEIDGGFIDRPFRRKARARVS